MTDAITTSGTERLRALGALITEIAGQAEACGDRAAGLRFVGELNKALGDLPALLTASRALLDRTDLGPVLASRLTGIWDEVAERRAELAEAEKVMARLAPALAELEEVKTRHAELTARIADVRRLDMLKDEVESLRAGQRDLERRRDELAGVAAAERDLAEAAAGAGTRAALRLAELDEETRRAVTRADRLTAEITEAEDRLAAQRGRSATLESDLAALYAQFAELENAAEQVIPRIDAHRRADQDLCAALGLGPLTKGPALDHIRTVLAELAERLDQTDQALREALRARDDEHAAARKPASLF
ncbi:hypothetical protein [Actinomadura fibrosa]|uniref:Chromosome partition protein Smc n=1 Tax=Actinomadura fibrosa TaxID=111802 RepID=A0ABW2XCJ8_9ACTN|nr:hypothetical protein [Actinomadura fibrosa]